MTGFDLSSSTFYIASFPYRQPDWIGTPWLTVLNLPPPMVCHAMPRGMSQPLPLPTPLAKKERHFLRLSGWRIKFLERQGDKTKTKIFNPAKTEIRSESRYPIHQEAETLKSCHAFQIAVQWRRSISLSLLSLKANVPSSPLNWWWCWNRGEVVG